MDFLEDLELYNEAMENAYDIITGKKTVDDIYDNLEKEEIDELHQLVREILDCAAPEIKPFYVKLEEMLALEGYNDE